MPNLLQKLLHRAHLMAPADADGAASGVGTATTEPEVDEFAAMFDHLASGGDPATEPGAAAAPAPAAAKGDAAEEGGDPGPDAAEGAAAAATEPAAAPAAPAAPAPSPAPAPAAPAPAPAAEPAPAPAAPAPVAAPAPAFELYTPEEKTQLESLRTEWPDIDKMIDLKLRQMQLDTLTTAFQEINARVTPLAQHVDTVQSSTHLEQIYEGHADYDQVYQPFKDWVGTLPAFLKASYENVMAEGTSDDVNTAISEFKKATNWQTPAPAASPAAAPAAAPTQPRQLSDAARKAAGSMAPVTTKRSVQPQGGDPNDFDAAWSEANAA